MTVEEAKNRRIIYQEDAQAHRYLDKLKWNRFQTAAAIESAILFAVTKTSVYIEQVFLLLISFIIIKIVCSLSSVDEKHARRHLERMQKFEQTNKTPFPESNDKVTGSTLMNQIIFLLLFFNGIILIYWLIKPLLQGGFIQIQLFHVQLDVSSLCKQIQCIRTQPK